MNEWHPLSQSCIWRCFIGSARQGDHVLLLQVSSCLASIAQGVHTKSRAWVARRTPQQPQQSTAQLQDGPSRTGTWSQNPLLGIFTAGDSVDVDGASSLMDGLLRSIGSVGKSGVTALSVFRCNSCACCSSLLQTFLEPYPTAKFSWTTAWPHSLC